MTLIQASICNNRKSVILIGDRLISSEIGEIDYEFESKALKLYQFGDFGVGFTGNISDIFNIVHKIEKEKKNWKDVMDFSSTVSDIMRKYIEEQREEIIYRYTLHSKEKFIEDSIENGTIPGELKEAVYHDLGSIEMDCGALIIGFTSNYNPKIIELDSFGKITDETDFLYSSVGSGQPFSQIFFDQHEYSAGYSIEDGLFFAFHAKKAAEFHAGVGEKTDIILISVVENENKKDIQSFLFLEEHTEIELLKQIYTEEQLEIQTLSKKFTAQIREKVLKL